MGNKMMKPATRGVEILLSLGGKNLGGQTNASLNRGMSPIKITNQINAEWDEYLPGIKTWNVICSGMFIKDKESFDILENSFMSNTELDVKISDGTIQYTGKGLITSFPLSAIYNDVFTYQVDILGTGELKPVYVSNNTTDNI